MSEDQTAFESNEATTEQLIQDRGAVVAPRITPADIDAAILSVHYCNGAEFDGARFPTSEMSLPCMTLCIIVLKNGFMVTGESACASPANFDEVVGRKIAYENARQKIWALEGYGLRTQLALIPYSQQASPTEGSVELGPLTFGNPAKDSVMTLAQTPSSATLHGLTGPQVAPLGDPDE